MKHRITSIHDIARALGVSASTVSRALKDHPDISPATRERVKAFAREVDYRPNALAIGLKHQRSHTIGIIVPEIVHHFFSTVLSGIEDLAYSRGFRVMICQSNEDYQRESLNLQALLDHRVDGILVSMSKTTTDYRHFFRAVGQGLPMVFFDRICPDLLTDRVVTDDFEGARLITSHLIERGCRRILHLGAPVHLEIGSERRRGYLQALTDAGLNPSHARIMDCDTPARLKESEAGFLKLAREIDGIFAVNDFTAVHAIRLLQENGYEIPGHIAVAGFGDDPLAEAVRPRLTTIEQKGYEMGRAAVSLLLERIDESLSKEGSVPARRRVFPAVLKQRESS